VLGEAGTGYDFDPATGAFFIHAHNCQHMTMFSFFVLNGFADLLYHFRVPAIPPGIDYLTGVLAFVIEGKNGNETRLPRISLRDPFAGILFLWHLHGRSPMDVQVHTLLIYAIVGSAVSTFVEMTRPRDVRPAVVRCACIMLQGFVLTSAQDVSMPVPYFQALGFGK